MQAIEVRGGGRRRSDLLSGRYAMVLLAAVAAVAAGFFLFASIAGGHAATGPGAGSAGHAPMVTRGNLPGDDTGAGPAQDSAPIRGSLP